MKQNSPSFSFLSPVVSAVKKNKKTLFPVSNLSFLPFIFSFFGQRKVFVADSSFVFDDVYNSFENSFGGLSGVPFGSFSHNLSGVFLSYYDQIFQRAYYQISFSWSLVDVCVCDKKILNKKLFYGKGKKSLVLTPSSCDYDVVFSFLEENGYCRKDVLSRPGDFVLRGGVLDFFSFGESFPVRINFFGGVSFYFLDVVSGEILDSSKKVFLRPFVKDNSVSLSSFFSDDDLFFSYKGGFLEILNPLALSGETFFFKGGFSSVLYHDFVELKNKKNVFVSSLLLSDGFLYNKKVVLPVWFFGQKKVAKLLSPSLSFVLGDFYVHEFFGVCCFLGLETSENNQQDRICLKFGDGVLKLDVKLLNRLTFFASHDKLGVVLDSFKGSSGWKKKKAQALKKANLFVSDLVASYVRRNKIKRPPYVFDSSLFDFFMSFFKYKDTVDQASSWKAVLNDLLSQSPMNRLLCGDVGFGKTEIALRAAFVAVLNFKKVLILAPTTILSKQLYECCLDRFDVFGFKIKEVSRLTKNHSVVFSNFLSGSIDILIGTHGVLRFGRVLSMADLFIVDEEHRFGVRDKEKIFSKNPSADFLSMSATPIPRSLQFALSGVRKISVMLTPPLLRRPIITNVLLYNKKVLLSSILSEISRGGQVFVVDNSVNNVLFLFNFLRRSLGGVSVSFLHGSLPKKEISLVMRSFRGGVCRVLVSTSIIESGIDISSANTIVINNAHMFGLSQLHQLRGRVGRSSSQGYAFLFLPLSFDQSSLAARRLLSVQRYNSLGAGYSLALKDLDLRGAGSLFGYSQSGVIPVGFNYYSKLIESVMVRSGFLNSDFIPFVSLGNDFVPLDFISFSGDRMSFYGLLSECSSLSSLSEIQENLISKYGKLPVSVENLFVSIKISLLLKNRDIDKIVCSSGFVVVSFFRSFSLGFPVLLNILNVLFKKYSLSFNFIDNGDSARIQFKHKDKDVYILVMSLVESLYE